MRFGVRLGVDPGHLHFHVKMLLKAGLIERADSGRGREKPYRALAKTVRVAPQLLHPCLGQPLQSGVQRGEDAGQQDQEGGDHQQDHRGGAHRGPGSSTAGAAAGSPVTGSRGVERQPSSSFCCRPNISFSSSGSMWS